MYTAKTMSAKRRTLDRLPAAVMALVMGLAFVSLFSPTYISVATRYDLTERYVESESYGTYVARTNKIYQIKPSGEKLVINLSDSTTAHDSYTGKSITDWRSCYITDLSTSSKFRRYANIPDSHEYMLICAVAFWPDPKVQNVGCPVDAFLLYNMSTGKVETKHVNVGFPIRVSSEQYTMKKGHEFEYLDSGILWPKGILSKDTSGDIRIISNACNLDRFSSRNDELLRKTGYNGTYWELRIIDQADQVFSLFYGPQKVFTKAGNPEDFDIPKLKGKKHTVDPRMLVFKTDGDRDYVIASIGTDDSDFCTAVHLDIHHYLPLLQ